MGGLWHQGPRLLPRTPPALAVTSTAHPQSPLARVLAGEAGSLGC